MTKTLENARYILFGTRKKNGSIVDTPVWFAVDQQDYYIFSAGDAGKVKRLRNFADSRIAPCTVIGKPLGDFINTQASIISDPKVIAYAHQKLLKKYGWQMRLLDFTSKLSGKYHHRKFIKASR